MSKPIHVSESEFDARVLQWSTPVVVDFWADWCAPCHRISPVLEELSAAYAGRVLVAKVDVEDEAQLAEKYDIRSIPTLVFIRDGEVVTRVSGVLPKSRLQEHFEALVSPA